jgi:hypothetical protein
MRRRSRSPFWNAPMPSLSDVQRGFAAAVVFGDSAALASLGIVAGKLGAAGRIAVYRNNVLGNYRNALAATYPVVLRLIGAPVFNAMSESFVRAHPSVRGDVNRYGGELARFLSFYPPMSELPYLPDVARLEWAIDQANIAADGDVLDLAALGAVPENMLGELRFKLHPSAQLVASPYPIFRIWQVNQASPDGEDRVDLGEGGDTLLIARGANGVTVERLTPGGHALLLALARNLKLGEAVERALAAEASFDLRAALKDHVARGAIAGFRLPRSSQPGTPA